MEVYSNGHTACPKCGEKFNLCDMDVGSLNTCMTLSASCKHNYGEWVRLLPDTEYSNKIKIDSSKIRRQLEDRLRKDEVLLKRLLYTIAWIEQRKGLRKGLLEDTLVKIK